MLVEDEKKIMERDFNEELGVQDSLNERIDEMVVLVREEQSLNKVYTDKQRDLNALI